MAGEIKHSRADGIVTVVIDQPEHRNAMSRSMWLQLREVFADLSADETLRCVILRGAGEKAFSAGADISEFEEIRGNSDAGRAYDDITGPALAAVADCRHPVIAEIHGACFGGGVELAVCADMRICGDSTSFAIPSARLGLVYSLQDLHRVARVVGVANLKEILFEMAPLDARHALRIGLVNRVVPDSEVGANVAATARRIADGAPLTHRWHKNALRLLDRAGHPDHLPEADHDSAHALLDSDDFHEGHRAFLEKRRPVFRGR